MDAQAQSIVVNGIRVDFATETIRDSEGDPVPLRPQSFAVLRQLVLQGGRLVTKEALMAAVWPGVAVTDDSLVQCIHEIRQAIGDESRAVVQTVARRGYRLVLPESAKSSELPGRRAPSEGHRMALGLLLVGLLALSGASWWMLRPLWTAPPQTLEEPVIAVLPFDNLGGDHAQDYFADGITEDLITDLSKLSGLHVIARNGVWQYRRQVVDTGAVAKSLGAQYVLEGSVRREGGALRINAQLIDAVSGLHLWADRYDGDVANVFAVQDQVIGEIVSALAVKLTADEAAAKGRAETNSPLAYDALLQGMDYLHRDTEDATGLAIEQFEKAIILDPDYNRAHAALAAAYWRIVQSFWFVAAGPGWVHSYEAFKTHLAIALQHPNAEAFALQAWQLEYEGRYPEAFDMIGRATALSPGDANNHIVRARILNAVGRAPEAEQEVRVAMRLDPGFSPAMLRVLAISLFHQKRYTEAIDVIVRLEAQSAVDLDDYRLLVSAAGHLGRLDEAKRAAAEYERLRRPALFDSLSVEDTAYFWAGDAFNYSQPYIDDLLEGLRKAGIPEGAGSDLLLARYKALMTRTLGEYDVAGAVKVDVPTAKALHERGAKFVDLRSRLEFSAGHIPGAVGLSLTEQLSREALAAVVPTDEEVVFYCHGKYCPTSPYGTAKAIAWGWRHVYYFAGGFPAWQDAGLPVEGGNT